MNSFIILWMVIFVEVILITYIVKKGVDVISDIKHARDFIIELQEKLIRIFGIYELLTWLENQLERVQKRLKKWIKKVTKYCF